MPASDREPLPPEGEGQGMARLEAVMRVLRGPDGCPWDREQTLASLKPYLVEEAYELLDAIDSGDPRKHCDELGDVLLQVVFQARIRQEQGEFDLDAVAHALTEKLIRRHPHVFGEVSAETSEQVLLNWEALKRREGRADGDPPRGTLEGVPRALPALLRAQRVQSKCAKAGFDWERPAQAHAKVIEELGELEAAIASGDRDAMVAELGDLLFAVVGHARSLDLDAEDALQQAIGRFAARFSALERQSHRDRVDLHELSVPELVRRWQNAKQEVAADSRTGGAAPAP